jgi:hypothetical protein
LVCAYDDERLPESPKPSLMKSTSLSLKMVISSFLIYIKWIIK